MNEEKKVIYDISSWRETERRNEMLLKAAFIYDLCMCNIIITIIYEGENYNKP